jgi:hypothetical protein
VACCAGEAVGCAEDGALGACLRLGLPSVLSRLSRAHPFASGPRVPHKLCSIPVINPLWRYVLAPQAASIWRAAGSDLVAPPAASPPPSIMHERLGEPPHPGAHVCEPCGHRPCRHRHCHRPERGSASGCGISEGAKGDLGAGPRPLACWQGWLRQTRFVRVNP